MQLNPLIYSMTTQTYCIVPPHLKRWETHNFLNVYSGFTPKLPRCLNLSVNNTFIIVVSTGVLQTNSVHNTRKQQEQSCYVTCNFI